MPQRYDRGVTWLSDADALAWRNPVVVLGRRLGSVRRVRSYIFTGVIRPARSRVTTQMLWSEQSNPQQRLELRITESQVRIDLDVDGSVDDDVSTVRNDAAELAQSLLDASLFPSAGHLVIELERVALPDGTVVELLPVFPGLRGLPADAPMIADEAEVAGLLIRSVGRSPELRAALTDVQRALTAGRDTTFYAYRSVEALRQRFVDPGDGDKTGPSWTRMWSAIGGTRDLVSSFQTQATRRRHGTVEKYSHEERRLALVNTREVIVLFARWLDAQPASTTDD